jgi:glycosyltransferase involved in cell wall biosynthesis
MDKTVILSPPAISIIVPVYNVEKFLNRCLDSIFQQQFSGVFEVIAVEDCSTDNSLQVLKEYQKREKKLVIIEHKANSKLSCARATGIRAASGDYIMHVDSDDWLLPNALENVYQIISTKNVDVVVFNYLRENNLGKQTIINAIKKNKVTINKKEVVEHFRGACWNKIVKRELLEDIIYGKIGINSEEDLLYSIEILIKAKSIYLSDKVHYTYFNNSSSITTTISPTHYLQHQPVVLRQLELIFLKYKLEQFFIDYFLDYFEKWIYLSIAKMHFWNKEDFTVVYDLLDSFNKSTIMAKSRINRLELAIENKIDCLAEVKKRFGFKMAFAIYLKSFISH